MINERDIILRGSCFCEKCTNSISTFIIYYIIYIYYILYYIYLLYIIAIKIGLFISVAQYISAVLYFSQKQLPRKIMSRSFIMDSAGYFMAVIFAATKVCSHYYLFNYSL